MTDSRRIFFELSFLARQFMLITKHRSAALTGKRRARLRQGDPTSFGAALEDQLVEANTKWIHFVAE
jgi:siroheme synthase